MPSVLISVTGSARPLDIDPKLEQLIKRGLAKAVSLPPFLGPQDVRVLAPGTAERFTPEELSGASYELTAAEVKAAMVAAATKREQESVLRTQAQRDAEAAKKKRVYSQAMVRIRFPDGICHL